MSIGYGGSEGAIFSTLSTPELAPLGLVGSNFKVQRKRRDVDLDVLTLAERVSTS